MNRFESVRTILRGIIRENRRLIVALVCYLVLIVIALIAFLPVRTSHDRFILGLVLALFSILIVKTIAHSKNESDK
jgi:hypothetical protein